MASDSWRNERPTAGLQVGNSQLSRKIDTDLLITLRLDLPSHRAFLRSVSTAGAARFVTSLSTYSRTSLRQIDSFSPFVHSELLL